MTNCIQHNRKMGVRWTSVVALWSTVSLFVVVQYSFCCVIKVEQIVAAYRDGYRIAGDIDELDFLSHEDYLVIPSLADRLASQLHSVCLRTCSYWYLFTVLLVSWVLVLEMTDSQHKGCGIPLLRNHLADSERVTSAAWFPLCVEFFDTDGLATDRASVLWKKTWCSYRKRFCFRNPSPTLSDNNNNVNVYGAVIMTISIARVNLMNSDWAPVGRQILRLSQPTWAGSPTINGCNHPQSTSTISICYYYSAWMLILILPSHGGWKAEST